MPPYSLLIPPTTDTTRFLSRPPRPDPIQIRLKHTSRLTLKAKATAFTDSISTKDLSFYDLLGIPESGTLPEIKHAYKQLARKYHPDVSPPDLVEEYTQRFIRVQEAYETLSDPRTRALYDRDMAKGLHLAFNARRRYQNLNDEDLDEKAEWKNRWESQLSELKIRSMNKESRGNMSRAARMRKQREGL